jgi:hypothetical protein
MVLRVRKSLYVLKQSSYNSYNSFMDLVIEIASIAACIDRGLLILGTHSAAVPMVVLSVTDLLIISKISEIRQIKKIIQKRFRMHDHGSV